MSKIPRLIKDCNPEDIFGIIDKYLVDSILPFVHIERNELVLTALNTISTDSIAVSVETLSKTTHTCMKNLENVFKNYTGLTPKQYAGVAKIRNVIDVTARHQEYSLTEVFEACGYYDHAHLNRDFRIIGALSASQIFSNIKTYLCYANPPFCIKYMSGDVRGINLLL